MGIIPDMSFLNNRFKSVSPSVNFDNIISIKDLSQEQIDSFNNILEFMKEQGKTANKQFTVSRNLVIATIIIMFLQIGYSVWSSSESNSIQKNITKIIESQSKQFEAISNMSSNLLRLQNQVRILEQENELLKKKK